MKTSDKLLLAFVGSSLVILSGVQFSLYSKYEKGEITSSKILFEEGFKKYNLPTRSPAFISVKGFQSVNIIPSDSFYFQLEKTSNGRAAYQFINDTVYVEGDGPERTNIHAETGPRSAVQPILKNSQEAKVIKLEFKILPGLSPQKLILYCPTNSKIRIEDGEIFLHGSIHPGEINIVMDINSCHLGFGNSYFYDSSFSNRFYNNIVIHSFKSGVDLNSKAVIHNFSISMDDRSILTDNNASLDSLGIECTDRSRLELAGKNLRKVKFIDR